MNDKLKVLLFALLLSMATAGLTACEQGPFEEAGEEVDDTIDDVEDSFD